MYRSITSFLVSQKHDVIVELGTNHPEINIQELEKINQQYPVYLFLCVASVEICRERALSRKRYFDPEALERRLHRDFPASYIAFLEKSSLAYFTLYMEQSLLKVSAELLAVLKQSSYEVS